MKNQDIAKNKSVKNPFSDTADESVISLYNYAIINGKNENEFYPYDYITREEFAKILSGTYNKLNRLTEYNNGSTSVHYAYNPSGLRKTKTQGEVTTNYYWNGSNLTYESKTNGEKNYYHYDVTGILSANFNGTVNNFLKDSHANVVSLLDYDGNVIRNYAYDAFRNEQTENDADINPFRYCGEYMDLSSGLIYLRNRYYDPATSRMLSEDPARQGTNWYIYCNNNPVNYIDPYGLDAIIITNRNSVGIEGVATAGHTSAIYQNANGQWFYTYWGNKAAAVIHIPDKYIKEYRRNGDVLGNSMASLADFNNSLNRFLSANGFKNITSNYTDATYIVGDFTASLDAAYDDVNSAYTNKHSKGALTTLDDGSKVFQGHNSPYNVGYRNCFDKTYASLSKGTLVNGTNVGAYMKDLDFKGGMIPNNAVPKFKEVFMNSSFTYEGSYSDLQNYATLYAQGSPWAQKWSKANYANKVIGW